MSPDASLLAIDVAHHYPIVPSINGRMTLMMSLSDVCCDDWRRCRNGARSTRTAWSTPTSSAPSSLPKTTTGKPLPTRDIRWSVHDIFTAGNDTTASTIAAALGVLATHPEIQAALREELGSVLQGRIPRAADLENLPYLDAFVRETLRLYPAAHLFMREVEVRRRPRRLQRP